MNLDFVSRLYSRRIRTAWRVGIAVLLVACLQSCGGKPESPAISAPESIPVPMGGILVAVSEQDARILDLDIDRAAGSPRAVVPRSVVDALVSRGDAFNEVAVDLLLRLVWEADEVPDDLLSTVTLSAKRWAELGSPVAHDWLARFYASGAIRGDPADSVPHARELFRLDLGSRFLLPRHVLCDTPAWVKSPYCATEAEDSASGVVGWREQLDEVVNLSLVRCGLFLEDDSDVDDCLEDLQLLADAEGSGIAGAGVRAVLAARASIASTSTSGRAASRIRRWLTDYSAGDGQNPTKLADVLADAYRIGSLSANQLEGISDLRTYVDGNPRASLNLLEPVRPILDRSDEGQERYCRLLSDHVSRSPKLEVLGTNADIADVLKCVMEGRGGFVRNMADALALKRYMLIGGNALHRVLGRGEFGIRYPFGLASGRGGYVDMARATFWGTRLLSPEDFEILEGKALVALGPSRFAMVQRAASRFVPSETNRIWPGLEYLGLLSIDEIRLGGDGEASTASSGSMRTGTGFLVSEDGSVVSNAHVVHGCDEIRSRSGLVLVLEATDAANDLALLRASSDMIMLPLVIRRNGAVLGERIVTLGYPVSSIGSGTLTVTTGEISALGGPRGDSRFVQISAPVQPGSSGGPVVGVNGEVLGMTTLTLSTPDIAEELGASLQNMNFAIRGSTILAFLDSHGVAVAETRGIDIGLAPAEIAERFASSVISIECRL